VARDLKLHVTGIKLFRGEIRCKFYIKNVSLRRVVYETPYPIILLHVSVVLCIGVT
jgi:hypothetical protein